MTEDSQRPAGGDEEKSATKKAVKAGCFYDGQPIPCKTSEGFWDPASGCYLTPKDKPLTFSDTSKIPPGSKFYRCWYVYDVEDGKPVGEARFESVIREPGETQTIDPREAARQVVESMVFVAPQLGLSPYVQSAAHKGIVNVPVWMWVTDPGASTTGPLTKRAALGGVAIEATGTVDRIDWSMGGGDVVTCKGAGTPFDRAAAEGKSLKEIPDSPTCGHRYRKTSRCENGQAFQVTATAYWTVHWTGGGMEGDIPLQFSRSLPLQVVDLRPVLVAPDGEGNTAATTPPRACS
ncbi:hypothetical protein [Kribbella caucasensis]|uniref:hypothetical protein n=1 Tax=Kribbella caucasensis TaxID=2512215 RepID=UPI0010609E02|nr:hypothetical protein [Kribbella sp. VKM Ac-2527]